MMKWADDTFTIEKKFKKDLFYMRKNYLRVGIFKNIRVIRHLYMSVVNLIKLPYTFMYHRRMARAVSKDIDLKANFVYFPLHLQPEMTTDSLGGVYRDQMLAIERVSELLPEGWFVYVKENPYQDEFRRGRCFFQRLKMLKTQSSFRTKRPPTSLSQTRNSSRQSRARRAGRLSRAAETCLRSGRRGINAFPERSCTRPISRLATF